MELERYMSVTSLEIKKALSLRHGDDFFTTECMSGPSGRGTYRFDAVAISKSWAHPKITGYEIKVSRSDFKADNKFYAYLPYFHELYIACPKGLIQREELPESIGLVWYNPDTGEVKAKKRAVYRTIDINVEMLLHIFYSHLRSDRTPFCSSRDEYARSYIEGRADQKRIGRELGSKMAQDMSEIQKKLDRYAYGNKDPARLEALEKVLSEHGICAFDTNDLVDKLDAALKKAYPPRLDYIIDSIARDVERLKSIKQTLSVEEATNELR